MIKKMFIVVIIFLSGLSGYFLLNASDFDIGQLSNITQETYPGEDAVICHWEIKHIISKLEKNEGSKNNTLSNLIQINEKKIIKVLTKAGIERYSRITDDYFKTLKSHSIDGYVSVKITLLRSSGDVIEQKTTISENTTKNKTEYSYSVHNLQINDSILIETTKESYEFSMQRVLLLDNIDSIIDGNYTLIVPDDVKIDAIVYNDLPYEYTSMQVNATINHVWTAKNINGIRNEMYVPLKDDCRFKVGYSIIQIGDIRFPSATALFSPYKKESILKVLSPDESKLINNVVEIDNYGDILELYTMIKKALIEIASKQNYSEDQKSLIIAKASAITVLNLQHNNISTFIGKFKMNDKGIIFHENFPKLKEYTHEVIVVHLKGVYYYFNFNEDGAVPIPLSAQGRYCMVEIKEGLIKFIKIPYLSLALINQDLEFDLEKPKKVKGAIRVNANGQWSNFLKAIWGFAGLDEELRFNRNLFIKHDYVLDNKILELSHNEVSTVYVYKEIDYSDNVKISKTNIELPFYNEYLTTFIADLDKPYRNQDVNLWAPTVVNLTVTLKKENIKNMLVDYPNDVKLSFLDYSDTEIKTAIDNDEAITTVSINYYKSSIDKKYFKEFIDYLKQIRDNLNKKYIIKTK